MKNIKVFRNTSLYIIAGLIPNFANLLILPLYTRFLTPADYGQVALVVTLVTFLGTVLGLQLSNSIKRLFFDYTGEARREYCATIINSTVIINLFILIPLHFAGPRLVNVLFPDIDIPYRTVLMPGLFLMFFQNIVNYGNAMLRVQERGWEVFAGALLHVAASVSLGIYGVVARGWGATGLLIAMAGSSALHGVLSLFFLRNDIMIKWNRMMFWKATKYSLPIIPHSLGGMLFMSSDKYVASFFVDVSAIGLYEFADKLALVFHFMVISFYHAMSPYFMRRSLEDRCATVAEFRPLITRWMAVFSLLCLCMSVLYKELIMILFPGNFHASYPFVPVLLIAYLFRGLYCFAADALLFMKKTFYVPVISLSAGIVNVLANLILIPRFGMLAAAWTTLLSVALTFMLALFLSNRVYPLKYDWGALLTIFSTMSMLIVVSLFVNTGCLLFDILVKTAIVGGFALLLWFLNFGGLRIWITGYLPIKKFQI